ncbi:EAL domain-containing protein [uncultured Citrobacter sp.]|uniref:EAL domain-containing protein n=1 Tax=Citrobacter portucalensis TaxID=1639133 RepID=UPI002597F7A8|nr:EAL domain-containing protein [uncultured Citrobacter sp.]
MLLDQNEVAVALAKKQFVPYFQPLHDVVTGDCIGAEILARLPLPDGSVSVPSKFLPMMDTDRDLPTLTRILMKEAETWLTGMIIPDGFVLTINITPNMAGEEWLTEACNRLMACANRRLILILELTERTPLTRNGPKWQSQLSRLMETGILLAIDDYGTGHSGLNLLLLSGAGILKLPREFVCRLGECDVTSGITDNVVHLAERLGLKLIAEGVETEAQQGLLAAKGIRLMQGWHFSPPLSGCDFKDYLSQYI